MTYLLRVLMVVGACMVFVGCGGGDDNNTDCMGDTVCEQCLEAARQPWCYSEAAKTADDPDMCENITIYWGEAAATVADWCIHDIAEIDKNCSLCSRIDNSDVRTACNADCQQ